MGGPVQPVRGNEVKMKTTAMDLEQKKIAIIRSVIEEQDPRVLKRAQALLCDAVDRRRSDALVIGYRASGNPVIKADFLERLKATLNDLKHHEYIGINELESLAESW
jgi:hypothetical protein